MRPRERLLEGLVRRFAAARDADAYALRGGMLVRAWVPIARAVRDVDLVCRLPYQPRDLRARITELLAIDLHDGIVFDEVFRLDTVPSKPPALQLFARGIVDEIHAEISADLAFVDVPRLHRHDGLFTCPPEMVIATKLRVIDELGHRAWRTKDLADLWHLLKRFTPGPLDHTVMSRRWWRDPHTAARWARYTLHDPSVPADLDAVVAEVHAQLTRHA